MRPRLAIMSVVAEGALPGDTIYDYAVDLQQLVNEIGAVEATVCFNEIELTARRFAYYGDVVDQYWNKVRKRWESANPGKRYPD